MVKPGHKQTEIGEIPEDWDVKKIGQVCTLINGRGFKPYEWKTNGLPIIRIQNLNGSEDFNYYQGNYQKKLEVQNGQLLFAWSGNRGTSFGPHVWKGDLGLLNYHTWKVVVDNNFVSSEFFLYALRQLTKFIEDKAHGASALVHTQKWEMESFDIAYPSDVFEQKTLANALSDVDELIVSMEKLITKKQDIKTATMQQLLTGKKRLPGFGEGKVFKQTEIGQIPEDWDLKTYGEVFAFLTTASNSRSDLSENGEVFYVHYGDIHTKFNFQIDFENGFVPFIEFQKVKSASYIQDGDLIMADASEDYEGIGKSVEVKGLYDKKAISGLHTFLLRDKDEIFALGYKGYLHSINAVKSSFDRLATGLKVYGLSKNNLKQVLIPVPPYKEQEKIIDILLSMETDIETLKVKLDKIYNIKQGMMQELLTGRTRLI